MKMSSILLIIFGVIIIVTPDIIAYLIGGLFVAIGSMMLLAQMKLNGAGFGKKKDAKGEEFVKFGNYKIYR